MKEDDVPIFEKKKQEEEKMLALVKEAPVMVTSQDIFNKMNGKAKDDGKDGKDQNAGRNIESGKPSRRHTLKMYRGFNQKTNSSLVAD